jgi:NADH-quinone oxidoreductase subunit M
MLYRRRHDFALDAYGGLARSAPALAGVTLLVLFAFIGVPGLSNFPGEFMALLGATSATPLLGGLATLAVIAAGVYGVNVYQRLFQGRAGERTADLRGAEVAVLAPIVAGILWLGLTPAPQLERIETASQVALAYQLQAERPTGPDGAEFEAAIAPAVTPGEPLADGGER